VIRSLVLSALSLCLCLPATAAVIRLEVDASDAPRRVLHAHLWFPAQPGPVTLTYPKWIPGEHSPTGPLGSISDLRFTSGGTLLTWQRDPVDMFAFHLLVPQGTGFEATLDYLSPSSEEAALGLPTTTAKLLDLRWNELLLYPAGAATDEVTLEAAITLPAGWSYATALVTRRNEGNRTTFDATSLTTLVDSPLIAGEFLKRYVVSQRAGVRHEIDIDSDDPSALAMTGGIQSSYGRLVDEAQAIFGGHHYGKYNWLVTLSDLIPNDGLEHHESSDNRATESSLLKESGQRDLAGLLAHEFVHSWNGKFRRPAGLATRDYQEPMHGELLWVYEGLTQHLGRLLATRAGLWSEAYYREYMAFVAGYLDHWPAREWRSVSDSATSVQLTFSSPWEFSSSRRRADYYNEANLIWIEADMVIRKQTRGQKSLDDFLRSFYGGGTAPQVKPYTYDDVLAALNGTAAYDWRSFLDSRLSSTTAHAPTGGFEKGGWRLVYDETPNVALAANEESRKWIDLRGSVGILLERESGTVVDVISKMPASKAGIAPGMKLIAVNSRKWTPESLHRAIQGSKDSSAPIELLMENNGYFATCRLDYHQGERYPHLVRDESKPDLFSASVKATVGAR